MQVAPHEQFTRYGQLLKAAEGIDLDDASRRFLWNIARWSEDALADAVALIEQLRRGPYPKFEPDERPLDLDKTEGEASDDPAS